jgi:ABC-2 type transport system ATP-binding protein
MAPEPESPAAAAARPAIAIRGVHKRFTQPRPLAAVLRHPLTRERIEVLRGVDLEVPAGALCGLLGPNGAGKTTLLRILAATVLPDRGRVHILGLDATRAPQRVHRAIGVVLGDERSFFWRLTARQNLRFFAALCDLPAAAARERIAELAGLLGLAGELDKPFRNLSTGWRHRLALARALLHDPPVLLMDEPTRGLDPGATARARRLIAERLVGRLGKTVLLATHDLAETRQLCDRLALLDGGRVLAQGPAAEVLPRAAAAFGLDGPGQPEGPEG